MAVADVVASTAFAVGTAVVMAALFYAGYLTGRRKQSPTRIIPVARKIDGRVVSKYSRAERRAHKRRSRG